jgi:hypothetical protein
VESGGRGEGEEQLEWEEQVIAIGVDVKDTPIHYKITCALEKFKYPFAVIGIPARDTPFKNSIGPKWHHYPLPS